MTEFEPIEITTGVDPLDPDSGVEQVHVFTIDGTPYHMPAEIPPAVGLRFLEAADQRGEAAAQARLMRECLGDDTYEALIGCNSVTGDQIQAIGEEIARRAFGPLGRPSRAVRRSNGSGTNGTTSKRTSGRSTGSRSGTRSAH